MKTKLIFSAILALAVFAPAAIFAADAATAATADLSTRIAEIAAIVAAWYGVVCAALNGLTVLVSAIVKQTPGASDDEAVEKFYASKPYKAIAWLFSWGDLIGEWVAKLKK
jgi:hypothetical protein